MKLIATSDFRNTHPKLISVEGTLKHDEHVHAGATITIDEKTAEGKGLIAQLNAAGRIISADDEVQVKRLRADLKIQEAADKRINTPPSTPPK